MPKLTKQLLSFSPVYNTFLHLLITVAQKAKQEILIPGFINTKHNREETFQRDKEHLCSILISFKILVFQSKHSRDNCGRQSMGTLILSGHRYRGFLHYHDRSEIVNVTAPL